MELCIFSISNISFCVRIGKLMEVKSLDLTLSYLYSIDKNDAVNMHEK